MTERDIQGFEEWGRSPVNAAAVELAQRPQGAHPDLGGEGGPRTVGRGYRSAFVRFSTPIGRMAVWLFCVPANHEYSDSSSRPRLGAGILDDALRPLGEGVLRPPLGGRVPFFNWRRLPTGWASDLTYIDADVALSPPEAGRRLAHRAHDGLARLRLVE